MNATSIWLERCLMNPVLCWLAGTTAVIGWHLPVVFELGMRSHWLHNLEDALSVGWPVVLVPYRAIFVKCDPFA